VDAAYQTTLAQTPPQKVAAQAIGDNATLRTDVYAGPKGTGVVVAATVDLKWRKLSIAKQHGPEAQREQPAPPLASILKMVQSGFDSALAKGYSDATTGLTLAITDVDRQQFDALDAHLTRAGTADDSDVTIADISRVAHVLTFAAFRALLVRAGDYYLGLWQTKLQIEAWIAA
jgi:hypothetical protein